MKVTLHRSESSKSPSPMLNRAYATVQISTYNRRAATESDTSLRSGDWTPSYEIKQEIQLFLIAELHANSSALFSSFAGLQASPTIT